MSTRTENDPLSEALFSRSRRTILALLYGHPDQDFYLRQIVRVAGGGHGAIQRELKHLSEAGIIARQLRNNQVFFRANSECPIFAEIKAIVVKTNGVANVLRSALGPLAARVRMAFVYGSLAAGRQKSGSDVDLLIVGEVGFREIVAGLTEAQSQLGREVNPTVYGIEEFHARLSAKNHFLEDVLKRKKIFLIGDQGELERLVAERLADRA